MATWVCTIAGTPVRIQDGWSIAETCNGRNRFDFQILVLNGEAEPERDQEVIFTKDGDREFAGLIVPGGRIHGDGSDFVGAPKVYDITALDYAILGDRVYTQADFGFPEGTLKEALELLSDFILDAVPVDGSQADGPTIPSIGYPKWKVNDILDQLTVLAGGWPWEYTYDRTMRMPEPGSESAPFNITEGDGHIMGDPVCEPVTEGYYNKVIVYGNGVTGEDEDAAEIVDHGRVVFQRDAPDVTEQDAVDLMATELLAQSLPLLRKFIYETDSVGLRCGMSQEIDIPSRGAGSLSGFIVEIRKQHDEGTVERVVSTVTVLEGNAYRAGWRERLRSFSGSASTAIAVSGGGGGTSFQRPRSTLSPGTDAVRSSSGPDWVPATKTGTRVRLNTVTRGGRSYRVYYRLRALSAGVSVQARLVNVDDPSISLGESTVETSQAYTPLASFAATLDSGEYDYELYLLPSAVNEDVQAYAYGE